MHFGIIVMAFATACAYSNGVLAAVGPKFPQVNEDTTIEAADAAVESLHSNVFLSGLKTYEDGTAAEEDRVFNLGKQEAALKGLTNKEKVAMEQVVKAKKLVAKQASISKLVESGINPKQLFKALDLKALGSDGKLKYNQYKALSGEDGASVAQMINANENLRSKANMLSYFEHAYKAHKKTTA